MVIRSTLSQPRAGGYLEGQLLVATTLITESCFNRAVLYICAHGDDGAMGVIINHVLPELNYSEVLEQLEIDYSSNFIEPTVYMGGPVESSRGLVVHSHDYSHSDTVHLTGEISITSNLQVLRDISEGNGPKKHLLTLGYSGWAPGQLEAEVEANSWISVPATSALIFDTDDDKKWNSAAQSLGIDMLKLSGDVGHA
ncbi:MAG: YqgE/AlgH family protein [Alphaproteobacteria bacterium]|nr:YqgE/AlgH family protein [Alphaproteobacteria bacterium]